jgi:hypothetical protein
MLTTPVQHEHFQNCHGQQVCDSCIPKVHNCPLCRAPKFTDPFSTVIDKTQDTASQWSTTCSAPGLADELYDSGHQSDSDVDSFDSFPSPSADTELDFPAERIDSLDRLIFGSSTNSESDRSSQSSIVSDDLDSILSSFYTETGMSAPAAALPQHHIKPLASRQTNIRRQTKKQKKVASVPKARKPKSEAVAGKSIQVKKEENLEIGPDSPFSGINLSDQTVCNMPFQQFVDAMDAAGFSKQQVAKGKLYRKRLKNRQHVMEYSSRKKQSTATLAEQNQELKASIFELQNKNEQLVSENKKLAEQLKTSQKIQANASFEMSAMKEQLNQLQRYVKNLSA